MQNTYRTATLKLTAYYTLIIVVICVIFSAAIYHFATHELQQGLLQQSQRLVTQFPGFDFTPAFRSSPAYQEGAHRILLNLLYFNVFVLVIASLAGYELAKRTLKPIEQSNEQQKRFTSDVSHELRTPLTALKMSTEVALLDTKAGKPTLREALSSNLEEATKMELLINSLLRLTRLEASELQQGFSDVDLAKVLQESAAEMTDRAASRSVTLQLESVETTNVRGDYTSLVQLCTILIDNALKYSPANSTVKLSSRQQGGRGYIVVSDSGIGIEPAELPYIFDRFYRADSARSRNVTAGFGIGLSIAKHIADIHQSVISVSSQVGKGTEVTVEFSVKGTEKSLATSLAKSA